MPSLVVTDLEASKRALLESWGVRDYPVRHLRDPLHPAGKSDELRCLPPEKLLELFHHASKGKVDLYRFIHNLVWQAYTLIMDKRRPPVDGDLRTFWYTDIKSPLSNLGLLDEKNPPWAKSPLPSSLTSGGIKSRRGFPDPDILDWRDFAPVPDDEDGQMVHTAGYISNVISDVFYDFVSNHIFRFHDFGFKDDLREDRFPATTRPAVIFASEKTTFSDFAEEMSSEFGCASQCLRGQPKLLTSEYFADELSKRVNLASGDFLILGCVDYDPWGEGLIEQFRDQLKIFGLTKSRIVSLITPDILSRDDLEQCKYKIPIRSQTVKTEVEEWIARGGGIDGQGYGLESDMVPKPLIRDRIAAALKVATG